MLQAIGKKIIIKRDKPVTVSESGILLPTKEIPRTGIVVSIGEQVTSPIKIGDRVMFARWEIWEVKDLDGKEYVVAEDKPEHISALIIDN